MWGLGGAEGEAPLWWEQQQPCPSPVMGSPTPSSPPVWGIEREKQNKTFCFVWEAEGGSHMLRER